MTTKRPRDPSVDGVPARRRHKPKSSETRVPRTTRPTIGWREWLELPDLGVETIKAKIDTGARTSALHAFDISVVQEDDVSVVHFSVHPLQDSRALSIPASAPLAGWREIRSSNGQKTRRPLIRTTLRWLDLEWPIELTLTNRDEMGFRMLLGRQAVRSRAVVDPGRSYLDRPRRDRGRELASQFRRPRPQEA